MLGLYCGGFGLERPDPTLAAITITDDDGSFAFGSVPPGRYFLTPVMTPLLVGGAVVDMAPGDAVFVELTGCSDCPPPL
jgi:hypothetical protein